MISEYFSPPGARPTSAPAMPLPIVSLDGLVLRLMITSAAPLATKAASGKRSSSRSPTTGTCFGVPVGVGVGVSTTIGDSTAVGV